jgi:hypothetical protein
MAPARGVANAHSTHVVLQSAGGVNLVNNAVVRDVAGKLDDSAILLVDVVSVE